MYQLEIFFSGSALLLSVYIALKNLFRKFRFNLNRLLALVALISAIEFSLILMHLLNIQLIPLAWKGRIFIALILYIIQLLFHLIYIYPDKKVKPVLLFFLISGTPGFIFTFATILTDFVIKDVAANGIVRFHANKGMPVFLLLIAIYLIAIIYDIIQKFKESATKALSRDLIYFLSGFTFSFVLMITLVFILPRFFGITQFRITGICISGILILLTLNYGVFDYSDLNFKKFYFGITSWILIFSILTIPVYLVIEYKDTLIPGATTSVAGISFIIFIFQFLFFNLLKSKVRSLENREYNNLSEIFTGFFQISGQITASDDLSAFWDSLYDNSINSFKTKFGIPSASLYLYNREENKFSSLYRYGNIVITEPITRDMAIVKSLSLQPGVIEESMLHSNILFAGNKERALAFLGKYNIKIAMAFLNDDNEIFAILFLGPLPKNRIYSKTFLEVLETYRQRFQHQLLNGLILENIRTKQIREHDSIVINAIKKKIIPEKLKQIDGVKVSSFNINNSLFGGDYFDTIKVDEKKICLFIADTSYSGIDSSILALEQYSTLHSQGNDQLTPHQLLNAMNWVISTSEYKKKEAPACCLTITSRGEVECCNAAYNHPVIYNNAEQSFSELQSEGIPIGTDGHFVYESKNMRIKGGNILFLYSNGILSALNNEGENYTLDRIKDIIRNNSDDPPPLLVRKIYQDLTNFVSGMKQNNDISLVLLRLE